MNSTFFNSWLSDTYRFSESDLNEVEELVELFPYSQSLRIIYLSALVQLEKSSFAVELKNSALYISDRKILFNLLEKHELSKEQVLAVNGDKDIEPIEVGDDRTLSVIDSFLSTLPEENIDFTGLEVSSDYMGYLFEDESANTVTESAPLDGQHLIDMFLSKPIEKKEVPTNIWNDVSPESVEKVSLDETPKSVEPESEDDGLFTETLAKIYIKQKRYSKALEILKKISLKYPNKNAYFVDQIRFLEKLIINAKSK